MENLIFLGAIAVILVIFTWTGIQEDKRVKKMIRNKLKEQYGKWSEKKYADGRMTSICSAVNTDASEFVIDDITWNDLDMDRLFQAMDFTRSAAGEEAVYRWLRIPVFQKEILEKREKHITFFAEHEKERLDYLMLMTEVGRTGKYSVYDYLGYLDAFPVKNCLITKLIDVVMLLSILLGFTVSGHFFWVFAALLGYHSFIYMKQKRKVEPYLTTFSYFIRILECVDKLNKMSPAFHQEFAEEIAKLKEEKARFASFRRFAFLALNSNDTTGGAELLQIFQVYINMAFHLDLIKLYSMLATVKEKKQDLIAILQGMGEMEACVSVAYTRAALDGYCKPEFVSATGEKKGTLTAGAKKVSLLYEAMDLYHPLIENPVKNSVSQEKGMLLTGSNASGKSTFLKAVAINALLAQTIHTVCASSYRANFFRIYSSMALRDSLQEGKSYFIVEIKSLKRIFDAARDDDNVMKIDAMKTDATKAPVLCTIDEVLRGTNTAERIAASTELLKALSKKQVLCFAATHDLELTSLLREEYDNYHFKEMIDGKEIVFPYELTQGPAKGRNAIKLMGALGFDQEIVTKAETLAGGLL